ncbi:hypothetical protein BHU72_01670 [Desulfuribacillus stibiiarsenatis]|uniref:Uncharacterized protein n=1 Tax=Desulfuribacillus stibiiarsenatis TaxID=1390249 RepID=A0A1E5LA41_9FIRM|nr:hypothetical protein [Desulfuribacillus stibiiarsenatis]OEH86990.1 hypothetical protein BHU72_01670 [Desulfuribacillus stibiiarsenatis]
MNKKKRRIFVVIILMWLVFAGTDFTLAALDKSPIFALPIVKYKDGGSVEFYGLGYKVIRYVNLSVESGPVVEKVEFGTWFMKFQR